MRTAVSVFCAGAMLLSAVTIPIAAAEKVTSATILALVEKNYKDINDYKVDAEVTIDSPQLYVKGSKMTIYFKKPNKVKIEAKEGFAVMPQVFAGNPATEIKSKFNVEYTGDSKLGGEPVYVLKLTPKSTSAPGNMKLFVEKKRGVIVGSEAKANDMTMISRWTYVKVDKKYWLPSQIKVEMSGTLSSPAYDPDEVKVKPAKTGKGTAVIKLKNYQVNKGLSDKIFEQKKSSGK
ncbi:MAG TPA: outer membrane lipoprotein-sorting protein [Armatimonadota bacterium]|nr:outer membrane lipoprotein-sorting protein [Armatimonadota bacterium]HPP73990.1 outer membrane lipoprotein-sorting protein [Armatimonadota bacterium]